MKKAAFLAFVLAALTAVMTVLSVRVSAANTVVHFTEVQVSIWPEYDKPSVLVMYNIYLPKGTSLPAQLRIPIPARAGAPNAVAYINPNGNFTNAEYTYSAGQQWETIELNALHPAVHIEYYDPALAKNGKHRSFVYEWPGGFSVDSFKVIVQQPKGAENMSISPKIGEGTPADDGFIYYHADMGALKPGDKFTVKIEYDKETDSLSITSAAPPTQALAKPIKGETTFRRILPWLAIILGLLFVVGGAVVYWNLRRAPAAPAPPRRRGRKQPLPPEARSADAEQGVVNYCPVCGARVQPGDRFCRVCGAKLRD